MNSSVLNLQIQMHKLEKSLNMTEIKLNCLVQWIQQKFGKSIP